MIRVAALIGSVFPAEAALQRTFKPKIIKKRGRKSSLFYIQVVSSSSSFLARVISSVTTSRTFLPWYSTS